MLGTVTEGTIMTEMQARIIARATQLFAERGFYGVSLAAIAEELGVTKQALLHHFGSKEKLYGAVLARLSERFAQAVEEAGQASGRAEDRVIGFFVRLARDARDDPGDTRLILRELLDNRQRALQADKWYLRPFLETLARMVQATGRWSAASEMQALAVAYHFLGAASYFAVSDPTLPRMFGPDRYAGLQTAFLAEYEAMLRRAFDG